MAEDHVVRALSNALETQRIHHAWLFTGTRGVGKTTLARILAKSLNCETGITATPCGQCSACLEIDQGRFVDYIEVDAASRRGVDEITPLLEQAIYAPSRGRFKIYTIDEVHMLTTHAFNAMLKTLEEPPAHLKFILATTDPQKIPVTVLSRCIQYNLKQMAPEAVVEHLQHLLAEESVQYEPAALQLIARGAAGSMRDALSLTDQAIAFSGNHITVEAMQDMLGTIDQSYLVNLINALLAGDAAKVVTLADAIADRGFSYEGALADLAIVLSRIAMEQRLPGTLDSDDPLYPEMMQVVQGANHDLLQLFYSIAVHGRKELVLAPDEYSGFVMICLRMFGFG
ncbi:DNA polymerase III subunit gamma/tau [Oligella ureolytica]